MSLAQTFDRLTPRSHVTISRPSTNQSLRPSTGDSGRSASPYRREKKPTLSATYSSDINAEYLKRGIIYGTKRKVNRHSRQGNYTDLEPSKVTVTDESDDETRKDLDADDIGVDITNSADFDTDLESDLDETDGKKSPEILTNTTNLKNIERNVQHPCWIAYLESCKLNKVVPVSYYLRHSDDVSLNLSHLGLGAIGIRPIAVSIVSNSRVTELNLTDNWLSVEGGRIICDVLKENQYITKLNLTNNRLGESFAGSLLESMRINNSLTHLDLSVNELDDKAAVYLADIVSISSTLEELSLSKNQLGELSGRIIGQALADNCNLRFLNISWNALNRNGAVSIAKALKTNNFLVKLDISWNGFSLEGAKALGEAMKVNQTLLELDISNNRITTEGAVLLGKGLTYNRALTKLHMNANPMQSAGCYAILASFLRNESPTVEYLGFLGILVNRDLKDLLTQAKQMMPHLQVLTGDNFLPPKPKKRLHPIIKLDNYVQKHKLRLIDFFNKFDKDGSMSVTYDEFREGLQEIGVKFTPDEIDFLIWELDRDGDGEINYSELVIGTQKMQEQEQQQHQTLLATEAT